jgi:hypothetical protein
VRFLMSIPDPRVLEVQLYEFAIAYMKVRAISTIGARGSNVTPGRGRDSLRVRQVNWLFHIAQIRW